MDCLMVGRRVERKADWTAEQKADLLVHPQAVQMVPTMVEMLAGRWADPMAETMVMRMASK